MKGIPECAILGPDLQYFMFKDPDRKCKHEDEASAVNAILYGEMFTVPWFLDSKKTEAVQRPLCPGHVYADPENKGPANADVVVIGKLPRPTDFDKDEEWNITGCRCFSPNNKAGQYFADTAAEFGMDISSWYVTYLFKCTHPMDEDRGSTLMATWLKESAPLLRYEISLVAPKFMLVCGAEAVKALFGNAAKITQMTGKIIDYAYMTAAGEEKVAKCVCCVSPYVAVRSNDAAEAAEYRTAFKKFCNVVNGVSATDVVDHYAVRTIEEWRATYKRIKEECGSDGHNMLAIDCEWNGEHPQNSNWWLRTVQLSWAHGVAVSIVVHNNKRKPIFTEEEMAEIIRDFQELWFSYIICGHFLDSDVEALVGGGFLPSFVDVPRIANSAKEYEQWIKNNEPCVFDTALAAHAYCETDDHSLTGQYMLRCPDVPRYDVSMEEWKAAYSKANKIRLKQIEGYGECPDEILIPYGNYDADVTRRLAVFYAEHLKEDVYGLNCWYAYSNSMQQWSPFLEMNVTGIPVDRDRLTDLTDLYGTEADRLLKKIKEYIRWPTFNPNSHYHMRELLYGEEYNGAKKEGKLRPEGARTLRVTPLYDTEGMPWDQAVKEKDNLAVPTSNARSLKILATEYMGRYRKSENTSKRDTTALYNATVLNDLRNAKLLRKVLSYVLKEPVVADEGEEIDQGLAAFICDDDRIRTHLYQTLDSGRAASARPAMQNISKRREADYAAIVGDKYIGPLRSILKAQDGHMLVWADFGGAELHALGVLSGDENMLDHVRRNTLPEDDPNFFDIHSQIAVSSFRLDCAPTKKGLESIGKVHWRIVAKSIIFGLAYGRGPAAIAEAVKEEGVFVSVDEVRKVIDVVKLTYPEAMRYLNESAERVFEPGWMTGVCKRYRRKPPHGYLPGDKIVDLGRVFKNFGPQNFVAESMRCALNNLYNYRFDRNDDLHYEILLQVHDEVLLSVPYKWVSFVCDTVLPECMCERVQFYPRTLDGILDKSRGPYKMGLDTSVGFSYGVKVKDWRKVCAELAAKQLNH